MKTYPIRKAIFYLFFVLLSILSSAHLPVEGTKTAPNTLEWDVSPSDPGCYRAFLKAREENPVLEKWFNALPDQEAKNNAVKAWEKLFTKPSWRTNTTYLSKVSRYADNGLEIVEEGGDLIVKQADGLVVGILDPNDVYDPGQMKVLGESSGRHFDPDEAGGVIVKKSWANPVINQSGIDDVSIHVARFTDPEAIANNNFMINRLNQIKNGQRVPDDFDKRFYTHELEEYSRFQNLGVGSGPHTETNYLNAHTASLEAYNINENVTKIYSPDVPFPQYAGY